VRIARFEHQGRVCFGSVKDQAVTALEGSLFDKPRETAAIFPLAAVRLLCPVSPSKIVCVGQNYLGHIQELGVPVPREPVIFFKPPSCLIGPGAAVVYPAGAKRVDYEGELAAVIGRTMTKAPEAEALKYVLGYACFNDVTERALVKKDPLLLSLAKGFDTFGPCGPFVVTGVDPGNLEIKTYLNGRVVQEDNTRNCVFSLERILHYVSARMTLNPGDVVITGTPKGIAPMKPGDLVEVEIEGLGRLRNPVRTSVG